MSLRIKNGRWEYRFTVNGHQVQEATGLAAIGPNKKEINRQKAENLEAMHRVAILEGRLGVRKLTPRSFSEAADEFITYREKNTRAESTARRTKVSMVSLKLYLGKTLVSDISSGDVDNYKTWRLTEHKVKQITLQHDFEALNLFFKWALRQNYCIKNPCIECDRPSGKDARRERVLTDAEERLYFANIKGTLHDVGRLMILQGCRPSEMRTLPIANVDLDAGTMKIAQSKTDAGRGRVLKLTDEAKAILARRIIAAEAKGSPWVFPGYDLRTRTENPQRYYSASGLVVRHDAAIDKINPCRNCGKRESRHPHAECAEFVVPVQPLFFVQYDLRHSFATRAVRAGVPITQLSKILGHVSIKITERYVHLAQQDMDAGMAHYNESLREKEAARKGAVQ